MAAKLTPKQRRLLDEIESLVQIFGLDYPNIVDYEPAARTPVLEVMKDQIVRSQVIVWYTLIDEHLNMVICHYFFGRKRKFAQLWKTKRFRLFNHYILEDLYLLQKLRLVRSIRPVPKSIVRTIELLNALRNGLAHSFFPQNLRKR
jgi:hypothetical protein